MIDNQEMLQKKFDMLMVSVCVYKRPYKVYDKSDFIGVG